MLKRSTIHHVSKVSISLIAYLLVVLNQHALDAADDIEEDTCSINIPALYIELMEYLSIQWSI